MVMHLRGLRKWGITLVALLLLMQLCSLRLNAAPGITVTASGTTYTLTANVAGDALTVSSAGAQVGTMAGNDGQLNGTIQFVAPQGTTFFIVTVESCNVQDDVMFCGFGSVPVTVSWPVWLPLVSD